jgi:hypothetical protein
LQVMEVQDGRVSQLLDSVIAMKFDSYSFHDNASEFESDCYACDPFIFSGVRGKEAASRAALSTCSLIEALCESQLIQSIICNTFVHPTIFRTLSDERV